MKVEGAAASKGKCATILIKLSNFHSTFSLYLSSSSALPVGWLSFVAAADGRWRECKLACHCNDDTFEAIVAPTANAIRAPTHRLDSFRLDCANFYCGARIKMTPPISAYLAGANARRKKENVSVKTTLPAGGRTEVAVSFFH